MSEAYTLPHDRPSEPARLRLMGHLLDPFTRRQIEALGLAPGWVCLEVGAGLGTVSQWLSERLQRTGEVVCSDLNADLLDGLQGPNLRVQALDLLRDPLPGERDLVIARAVLHHLRDWSEAIPRLVEALKPGGALLLIEPDFTPALMQPATSYFWQAFVAGGQNNGIDMLLGPKLPARLAELGLERVQGESFSPLFNGGSAWAEYWVRSMEAVKPNFPPPVATEIERYQQMFARPDFWTQVCAFTAVSGFRPRA